MSNFFMIWLYRFCVLLYILLNFLYMKKLDGLLCFRNSVYNVGVSVNELILFNMVDVVMVRVNCL